MFNSNPFAKFSKAKNKAAICRNTVRLATIHELGLVPWSQGRFSGLPRQIDPGASGCYSHLAATEERDSKSWPAISATR